MIGNFSSKVLSFVLVFFMTYFLSKQEIGQYDLILTTVSFIVPCVSLLIDSALLRWLLDPEQKDRKDVIFQNVYGLLLFNILIFTCLFWITVQFIDYPLSGYIYVFSLLMIVFPTMQQGTRGLGKNKVYATTSVVYSLLYVGFTGVVLYMFNPGIKGVLLANIIALLIVIGWLFVENDLARHLRHLKLNKKIIKDFCDYSLPLLPNTLSWWLIGSSTRYIILAYLGSDYNGLFAISYKYPTIVLVMTNVFTLAWQEKIIRTEEAHEAEEQFSKTLKMYINLMFGVVIILSSCSKVLMKLVDQSYFEAWKYIPVLLLAVMIQALASFYGAAYLRVRKTRGIFTSSIVGGLTTVGSAFILVRYGLYGISISILLGYAAMLLYRIIQVRNFMTIKFPVGRFVQMLVLFSLVTASLYIEHPLAFIPSFIAACSIFIIYNYRLISNTIKSKISSKWKKV